MSIIKKAAGRLIPYFREYDLEAEISIMTDQGFPERKARVYLSESRNKYRNLYRLGKLADGTDRITSLAGAVIEGLGLATGGAPGLLLNGIEEVVEMTIKLPFFAYLAKERRIGDILKLAAIEGFTFLTPVAGDLIDAGSNLYINTARNIIREEAYQAYSQNLNKGD